MMKQRYLSILMGLIVMYVACSENNNSNSEDGGVWDSDTSIIDNTSDTEAEELEEFLDGIPEEFRIPGEPPDSTNTGIQGMGLLESDLTATGSVHIRPSGVSVSEGGTLVQIDDDNPLVQAGNIVFGEGGEITVQKLNVDDGIYIYDGVKNITIIGCLIKRGKYAIECAKDTENIQIQYCTLTNELEWVTEGVSEPHWCSANGDAERKGIMANNVTITHCNISAYADGIYLGNNVTIRDNYFHNLYHHSPGWHGEPGDSTHSDGIQSAGGGNYIIQHNTIDARVKNSAIILGTTYNNIEDVIIEKNYLFGGNACAYVRKAASEENFDFANIVLQNNVFIPDTPGHAISYTEGEDILFLDNFKREEGVWTPLMN